MILLAIVLFLFALTALTPPFIVLLGQFPGSVPAKLETFISTYNGTIISLGTLFLVSALALLTTHLSSASAEKRERYNRRVQSELKLAEFRQKWIEDMRDDISELLRLSFHSSNEGEVSNAYKLSVKIQMRLNLSEDLAEDLAKALEVVSRPGLSDLEHSAALANVAVTSRKYLKQEWSRLKNDIQTARLLDEVPQ